MGARSQLARAYYDLATLLDAGVPILRSLDILIQGQRGRFKRVFSQVRESLSKGSSFSESLDEQRRASRAGSNAHRGGRTGAAARFFGCCPWHELSAITRQIPGPAVPLFSPRGMIHPCRP
jgi:hypothetical protein